MVNHRLTNGNGVGGLRPDDHTAPSTPRPLTGTHFYLLAYLLTQVGETALGHALNEDNLEVAQALRAAGAKA